MGARALHARRTSSASSTWPTRCTARPARRSSRTSRTTSPASTPTSPRRASNPLKMPGEYAAIGKPGPADWKVTDVMATASLVGGIFGKGGGGELDSALLLAGRRRSASARAAESASGRTSARAEDPEAPTTVRRQALPLPGRAAEAAPRRRCRCRTAAHASTAAEGRQLGASAASAGLGGLLGASRARCRTRCWSRARESKSGHPIAVFGPQTAYFAPQLLMEVDVHGPGIDARGAAFAGHQPVRAARPRARLRLERDLGRPGHHRHLRRAAVRPGRLHADDRLDALPLPAASACRSRCSSRRTAGRRPGRRHAARHRDAARRAHQARPGDRARHRARQAGGVHEAALDLLPRGRLGARLRRT